MSAPLPEPPGIGAAATYDGAVNGTTGTEPRPRRADPQRDGLGRPIRRQQRDAAERLLLVMLAGGPVPSSKIKAAAIRAGIGLRTLYRAKATAGVRSVAVPHRGRGATWMWYRP